MVSATSFTEPREAGVDWGGEVAKGKTNVFVFDWKDHPAKTQAWYDERKESFDDRGLSHLFAQEIDRDYAASVQGTIIKSAWVQAAIGAAEKLGLEITGETIGGLDVADNDGTGDRNALSIRRGIHLGYLSHWAEDVEDVGVTTRMAVAELERFKPVTLEYDAIGMGAGVKAEANRLAASEVPSEKRAIKRITFVPWAASRTPLRPNEKLDPTDPHSRKNKDFFKNLRAQAWWQLARRFERTYRAVTKGVEFDPDDLISIDPDLPHLHELEKELCQVTGGNSTGSLKFTINKAPEGTKSPNLADSVVMNYWPVTFADPEWYVGRSSK